MSDTPTPPPLKFPRVSPALVGAGVLVVALGFGLPMLASGPAPEAPAHDTAAKRAGPEPIRPPDGTNLIGSLLKLVVGGAVVCGACVLVARVIGQRPPPASGAMDVVASIAVAQCVLHLVRAGDRRLLIGTDLGGVKAVVELPGPAPELPPTPPTAASAAPTEPAPAALTQDEILNLLLRLRARTDAPPPA